MKVQEYCSLAECCIMQKQEEKIAKRERPQEKIGFKIDTKQIRGKEITTNDRAWKIIKMIEKRELRT